jgi:hypothetical protein
MGSTDLSKIQRDHLPRLAYIYVRQSSLHQVQFNTASTARQYNLVERAKELGWPDEKIIVVDQDQGHSGASADDDSALDNNNSEFDELSENKTTL